MAVLAFSRLTGDNSPTLFRQHIQAGNKNHTFRANFSRKVGDLIHFYEEHPQQANSGAKPFEVEKDKADFWGKSDKGVLLPRIAAIERWRMTFFKDNEEDRVLFEIGSIHVDENILEAVSLNDGFKRTEDFLSWFQSLAKKRNTSTLEGQLIHWKTSTVYDHTTAKFYQPN